MVHKIHSRGTKVRANPVEWLLQADYREQTEEQSSLTMDLLEELWLKKSLLRDMPPLPCKEYNFCD